MDRQLGDTWGMTIDRFNLAAAHWRAGRSDTGRSHLAAILEEVIRLEDIELMIEAPQIAPPAEAVLWTTRLAPHESRKLNIQGIPAGGGFYPISIVVRS